MNTDEILRQLKNAGLHVLGPGADSTTVYIEDPSCILRGFETFVEYAWIIISILTGLLLFGWAISLIRGAKSSLMTNIRNLMIMFGTLSLAIPIVNLIWGGDLFGRGCRRIEISVADVNRIMAVRNARLGKNGELYETLEIQDTGAVMDSGAVADALGAVPYPETGPVQSLPEPAGDSAEPAPDATTTPPATNERNDARNNRSAYAISAAAAGNDVIYNYSDERRIRFTGGTRAWRNTNPGNLRYSDFSRRMGAIGQAGGFAVFPSEQVGMDAVAALLKSDTYRGLTIAGAINRYAPPSENDTARYHRKLERLTGLNINRRLADLSPSELENVANAIRQIEGWRSGRKVEL